MYQTVKAVAAVRGGNEYPNIMGQVKFYQKKHYVVIEAKIEGLPQTDTGFFGFHIHEGTACTGDNFSSTGNHYNPKNSMHPTHTGDLPPLLLCNSGAYLAVATNRFRLTDVIGKTIVIHSHPDDFTSQPAGNAGTKIACGKVYAL